MSTTDKEQIRVHGPSHTPLRQYQHTPIDFASVKASLLDIAKDDLAHFSPATSNR